MQAAACPPVKAKEGEVNKKERPSADRDARWGRKGGKTVFGYKMHIGVDAEHTLIRKVAFTPASLTDTEAADQLISGDEKAARGALERSWELNKSARLTKNLLDVLDRIDAFEVVQSGDFIFKFAKNNVILNGERNGITGNFTGSEFAGACYSPDGEWLFANIQSPGITVAITGPWQNGAL